MPLKEIKIFISHADDTQKECEFSKNIIREESEYHYEKEGYKLVPISWEDIPRGEPGDPQEKLIDPYIKDPDCHLVVIIFWTRYGSPTLKSDSGIAHEYELAKNEKKHILIFFGNKNIRPNNIDPEQLHKVKIFKEKIEKERVYGHCGCFDEEEDFREKFRRQLVSNIDKIKTNIGNIDPDFNLFNRGF